MGNAFAFTGNLNTALLAADRIFNLLDSKPNIDTNRGDKLQQIEGNVMFTDGDFSYPARKDVQILNKLNLSIQKGQKIALVGESGCGKSTILQLIQRLYDLDKGDLMFEGQNISRLNVPNLRSRLGIVSQEPVLFDRDIKIVVCPLIIEV